MMTKHPDEKLTLTRDKNLVIISLNLRNQYKAIEIYDVISAQIDHGFVHLELNTGDTP